MPEINPDAQSKKAIDPLIQRVADLTPDCRDTLAELELPLLPEQGDDSPEAATIRTAQKLLLHTYELLLPEVSGVKAESIDNMSSERLANPQAFVEATLGLLQAYSDKQTDKAHEPITIKSALAISSIIARPELSKPTLNKAQRIVDNSPTAGRVLAGLRTLQPTAPTK